MRLRDKVALVTGAARGIGEGVVRAFAAEGATVWATDLDLAGCERLAGETGGRAARLDVRDEAGWDGVIAALMARDGRLDILVNNAGITGFEEGAAAHDPEHASLADWRAVHATNLDGTFLGCRAAIRAMRPVGRGAIVNIASRSGMVGIPGAAAYASSKAAIRNHTKSVALWCAGQGLDIRCNVINPAAILTPMWEPFLGDGPERAARMAELVAECPQRRMGAVEEVAAVAVLLASDECRYMTGAEIVVDGGILAGSAAGPAAAAETG
jgi:NAD(P)-dependent dehydrogenase (short-subunit alcohol dehydrogenase family)